MSLVTSLGFNAMGCVRAASSVMGHRASLSKIVVDAGDRVELRQVDWIFRASIGVKKRPVVGMNVRLPFNVIWKKDNASPLLQTFLAQVQASQS